MEYKPEEISLSGDGYLHPHSVALQPLAFIPKKNSSSSFAAGLSLSKRKKRRKKNTVGYNDAYCT